MLDNSTGIVVAVSGGADSVALLDILMRVASAVRGISESNAQTSSELALHIAHLDHTLRGSQSTADAEFVRALAKRLGLRITIKSLDVRAAATRAKRGIEEIARELRYDFLRAVAIEAGADRIAVGHTMTDQAETFLMRLLRGAGTRGLAAMRPVSSVPVPHQLADGGRGAGEQAGSGDLCSATPPLLSPSAPLLIRPLLCVTREEVEAYCREHDLEFRTDETNRSLHFTRNRIRNEVLPTLKTINSLAVQSIARAAEHLSSDQDVLNALATTFLDVARIDFRAPQHIGDGSGVRYSVYSLREQPAAMRRRMIIEAIRQAQAPGEITTAHIAAVEELTGSKASGKHVVLPGGLEVWREFETLLFKPAAEGPDEQAYQYSLGFESSIVEAGGFRFELQRGLPGYLREAVIEEAEREKRLSGWNWMIVALDDSTLPELLIVRPRRRGERVYVAGKRKTIKLKNLMIDHRIPTSRRASWPIVTTPDGCYIWSPGLPPSLEFAARDETHGLATIRVAVI